MWLPCASPSTGEVAAEHPQEFDEPHARCEFWARMPPRPAPDPLHAVARFLSIVGHPFLVLPASIGAIAVLRGGDPRTALALAAAFLVVSLAIVLGVRAGRFNDFDVS